MLHYHGTKTKLEINIYSYYCYPISFLILTNKSRASNGFTMQSSAQICLASPEISQAFALYIITGMCFSLLLDFISLQTSSPDILGKPKSNNIKSGVFFSNQVNASSPVVDIITS